MENNDTHNFFVVNYVVGIIKILSVSLFEDTNKLLRAALSQIL